MAGQQEPGPSTAPGFSSYLTGVISQGLVLTAHWAKLCLPLLVASLLATMSKCPGRCGIADRAHLLDHMAAATQGSYALPIGGGPGWQGGGNRGNSNSG